MNTASRGLTRRHSIPQELEDPEDCTIGESAGQQFYHVDHDEQDEQDETLNEKQQLPLPPQQRPPQALVGIVVEDVQRTPAKLRDQLGTLPKEVRNLVAGGLAGIVAKTAVAPVDRVKILFQVSSVEFKISSFTTVIYNIARNEGVLALWKGNMATMIRVFPYSGIQFMVFDRIKEYFLKEHEAGRYWFEQRRLPLAPGPSTSQSMPLPTAKKWGLTPMESLVAGMVAGTCSVACTYPMDLARTQLAVLKKRREVLHDPRDGILHLLRENFAKQGIHGLFRGVVPTILGILPYAGIAFAINEQSKREIQSISGREVTTWERVQCGAFAGLVAQTVTYPIEVIRRRMQTAGIIGSDETALNNLGTTSFKSQLHQPSSTGQTTMIGTIRTVYREQGMNGFFKGVSMNWLKGPIAFAISFTVFDLTQMVLESEQDRAMKAQQPLRRLMTLRRLPTRENKPSA